MSNLPRYVQRSGMDVLPHPIFAPGVQVYGFLVKSNPDALVRVLQPLNTVAAGKIEYVPLMPYTLLAVVDLPSIRSMVEPYSNVGTVKETDFAVWVLAAAGKRHGGVLVAERLVWYVPYIFVNDSFGMNAGRELFGFPKQWGWFDTLPQNHTDFNGTNVDATVIQKYGYNAQATRQQLLSITPQVTNPDAGKPWQNFEEMLSDIRKIISGDGELVVPGIRFIANTLEDLLKQQAPLAFLKEFRDIGNGEQAAYQAVVEAPLKVKLNNLSRLSHHFQITINPYESHPIAADLGLQGENNTFQPAFSFWGNIDMTFEKGKVIAQPDQPGGCLSFFWNMFRS